MAYTYTYTAQELQEHHDLVEKLSVDGNPNAIAVLSNQNLLLNSNFAEETPDDSQPKPDDTPRDYAPDHQVFKYWYADESLGAEGLTYDNGYVSGVSGAIYQDVPVQNGIEYLTQFVASLSDKALVPNESGISYTLVGDVYRVKIAFPASNVFVAKFETGDVATKADVSAHEGINSGNVIHYAMTTYESLSDLIDSPLSVGDFAQLKERAFAKYEIRPSDFTLMPGDLVLNSGLIAELILSPVNDIRWWGAVADYDDQSKTGTDNTASIQSALSRANGSDSLILSGAGLSYMISSTIYFPNRYTEITDITIAADTSWDAGTVVNYDMGSAEFPVTSQQRLNRGNPMVRIFRDDTTYTGEEFRGNALRRFKLLCNDVAPGAWFEETRRLIVDDFEVHEQYGYGIAWLVKNTEGEMLSGKIYEAKWGSAKQSDPVTNPYNSYGVVQTCADVLFNNIVSNFSAAPIWADGFYNTQWNNIHVYNGNGIASPLKNIVIGEDCHGIVITNIYNDNGFIEMKSFDHTISGGKFAKTSASSNENFAYLVATSPTSRISGLFIDGIAGNYKMIGLGESDGNKFTTSNNCYVPKMLGDDSTENYAGFMSNKVVKLNITSGEWSGSGSFYSRTVDLSPYTISDDIPTSVKVSFSDNTTAPTSVRNFSYKWADFDTTKTLTIYSNTNATANVYITINEGYEQLA